MQWEPIIDPDWMFLVEDRPTALGTGDGKDVFFATRRSVAPNDVRMYKLTPSDEKVYSLAGIPSGLPSNGVVSRLIVQSNMVVYAAYNLFGGTEAYPYGQGYLLKTTDGGISWRKIATTAGGPSPFPISGLPKDANVTRFNVAKAVLLSPFLSL